MYPPAEDKKELADAPTAEFKLACGIDARFLVQARSGAAMSHDGIFPLLPEITRNHLQTMTLLQAYN